MKNFLISFILLNFLIIVGLSKTNEYLKLKIDDIEKKYKVENALFYNDVEVKLDTTVQIASDEIVENLYYPKVISGDNTILRLILKKSEKTFDLLIEFNNDSSNKINLTDDNAKIYINQGFKLQSLNQSAKNISGKVELVGLSDKSIRKAIVDFTFKRSVEKRLESVSLKGAFSPVFSDLKNEKLFSEIVKAKGDNEYIRHLELAGILASIFLVILLTN